MGNAGRPLRSDRAANVSDDHQSYSQAVLVYLVRLLTHAIAVMRELPLKKKNPRSWGLFSLTRFSIIIKQSSKKYNSPKLVSRGLVLNLASYLLSTHYIAARRICLYVARASGLWRS